MPGTVSAGFDKQSRCNISHSAPSGDEFRKELSSASSSRVFPRLAPSLIYNTVTKCDGMNTFVNTFIYMYIYIIYVCIYIYIIYVYIYIYIYIYIYGVQYERVKLMTN
jgi:hypothetical protein